MTAHQYLSQAEHIDALINTHIEEVERLKCLADCLPTMDFSKDRIKGGVQVQSKMTEIVNKYVDLERKINEEIDTYVDLQREIRKAVEAVTDIRFKLLLRYKYLSNKKYSLEEIAEKMNYSVSHIWRLHQQALDAVIVPDKYKAT